MKVVLIQNVAGLGKIDETKDVAEGYARNFLFARNLAVPASPQVLKDLQAKKQRVIKNTEEELRHEQSTADRLDGYELEFREKGSDAGQLYAAISPQKIVEALKKAGFTVGKNQIEMKPVKEAGEYGAKIRLGHGLEAGITIIVSIIK